MADLLIFFCVPVGIFLIINIYFNYLNGAMRSPGYAEDVAYDVVEEDGTARQCKKCNATKMPRTHHCSVCSKCVIK